VTADESSDLFQVSRREFKRGGCEVFLQVLPTFGARNGNDVIPLVQQPGERDLARRGRFFLPLATDVLAAKAPRALTGVDETATPEPEP
jgi:hypothetical protein